VVSVKLVQLFEATSLQSKLQGSAIKYPVYHGSTDVFKKFNRPPHGVFFTPHRDWAEEHYGTSIITCYLNVPKLYTLDWNNRDDEKILDMLFDRDYTALAGAIPSIQQQGYAAMQTTSDSEMICVFNNAKIYSAETGALM
jgi:hypothetical protein